MLCIPLRNSIFAGILKHRMCLNTRMAAEDTPGLSSSATVLVGSLMTLSLIPVFEVADVVLWSL